MVKINKKRSGLQFLLIAFTIAALLLTGYSCSTSDDYITRAEARRLIEQNGISLNQEKINSVEKNITEEDLNENSIILQKGKKVFLKVKFK